MPSVSVDLGNIAVAGKRPNLSLTLSSSCSISVPAQWPANPTAEELSQASSSGKFWISKAGSCQIDISTLVNDEVPDATSLDPSIMTAVADFASECPVWEHTGLELRTNHAFHARLDQSHAQASYFLHHPDLSSEMISPPGVPVAQFEALRCQVNYSFKSARNQTQRKPQSSQKASPGSMDSAEDPGKALTSHTYSLRSNPRRSRKATVAQEESNGSGLSSIPDFDAVTPDGCDEQDIESLVSEAIADMASLLDFALRKFIGVRGASHGFRTIKSTTSPSLIDIAPAVWDLLYLQTMSAHAQVIPSLSAGIARLRNAQSASLQEKLDLLGRRGLSDDGNQGSAGTEQDATDEVKKRLSLLCQTRIRPEPLKGPYIARKAGQNTFEESPPEHFLAQGELEGLSHYTDDLNSSALVDAERYHLFADHDDYITLPEAPAGLIHPETGHLEPGGGSRMLEDGEPPSEEWTNSSEGDYFYTDGQGNVYPINRDGFPEDHQIEWPSAQGLAGSAEFGLEEDESAERQLDGDENQAYIMYHEVEHWSPSQGAHHDPGLAPDQIVPLSSPPYLADAPFHDWAGG